MLYLHKFMKIDFCKSPLISPNQPFVKLKLLFLVRSRDLKASYPKTQNSTLCNK